MARPIGHEVVRSISGPWTVVVPGAARRVRTNMPAARGSPGSTWPPESGRKNGTARKTDATAGTVTNHIAASRRVLAELKWCRDGANARKAAADARARRSSPMPPPAAITYSRPGVASKVA